MILDQKAGILKMSWNKNTVKKGLSIALVSLLLYATVSLAVTKAVYDACFPRYEGTASSAATSSALAEREEIVFASGENRLRGYRYGNGAGELIVLAPGFRACCDDYLSLIAALRERGWDVLVYDATGSGASEGESSVGFPQALFDLDAALTFAEETYDYPCCYLLGHSRGGWAACGMLASDHAVAGVATVSALNSPMEAVIAPATRYVGPLAYGNYPFLWIYQTLLFGRTAVDVCADEAINNSTAPVLIVQGAADGDAPTDAFSLYSHREDIRTQGEEYLLETRPGQDGHTDLLFAPGGGVNEGLVDEIDGFFARCGQGR